MQKSLKKGLLLAWILFFWGVLLHTQAQQTTGELKLEITAGNSCCVYWTSVAFWEKDVNFGITEFTGDFLSYHGTPSWWCKDLLWTETWRVMYIEMSWDMENGNWWIIPAENVKISFDTTTLVWGNCEYVQNIWNDISLSWAVSILEKREVIQNYGKICELGTSNVKLKVTTMTGQAPGNYVGTLVINLPNFVSNICENVWDLRGTFYDAETDGLAFITSPSWVEGVTSNWGKFSYNAGDIVTFKVNNIVLGSVSPRWDGKVFLPELFDLPRTAYNEENVLKAGQLLQSLDVDNDPSNGIILTSNITGITQSGTIKSINLTTAVSQAWKTVKNVVEVQDHLAKTLDQEFLLWASLVKDIWPGITGSAMSWYPYFVSSGKRYFAANDWVNWNELRVSDGTESWTRMLNIRTWADSALVSPVRFWSDWNKLYFNANDGVNWSELRVSDWTENWTYMLKNIRAWSASASFSNLTYFSNRMFFNANDWIYGQELRVSDGTESWTYMFKDIRTWSTSWGSTNLTVAWNKLFFNAITPTELQELRVSDGTVTGTYMVKDIDPRLYSWSNPLYITAFWNKVLFVPDDWIHWRELRVSDGTSGWTYIVKDIYSWLTGSLPTYLTLVWNKMFFVANNWIHWKELRVSDWTENWTYMVKDINLWNKDSNPVHLIWTSWNKLYFQATDSTYWMELRVSDWTNWWTYMVKDINVWWGNSVPTISRAYWNNVYFHANNWINWSELWTSDGTLSWTYMMQDIWSWSSGLWVNNVFKLNNIFYFLASNGLSWLERWRFVEDIP